MQGLHLFTQEVWVVKSQDQCFNNSSDLVLHQEEVQILYETLFFTSVLRI